MLIDIMKLNQPNEYRKQIKGFHMAFNTKEILNWELSNYRFKPEGNAERLRLNALHRKNARIYA